MRPSDQADAFEAIFGETGFVSRGLRLWAARLDGVWRLQMKGPQELRKSYAPVSLTIRASARPLSLSSPGRWSRLPARRRPMS